MKKYNIKNYVRYKNDVKTSIANIEGLMWDEYSRDELIIKFLPLVESLARKFPTSDQASGILSINDLIQEGNKGLILSIDKLDWEKLNDSNDIEKTLKSFISKRIKGSIRRALDINRGNIKIPENKLIEMRKNPDERKVAMFFNSVFSSIDEIAKNSDQQESWAANIPDNSKEYNIDLMNSYLLSIMKQYLNYKQYEVLRLSYGLDCDKMYSPNIAKLLGVGSVRVSQIKREAIDILIDNTSESQVIDYL